MSDFCLEQLELLLKQRFRQRIRAGNLVFRFARHGEEALSVLAEEPDIGLLLLDINMPVMDGLTLLAELRARKSPARAVIGRVGGRREHHHHRVSALGGRQRLERLQEREAVHDRHVDVQQDEIDAVRWLGGQHLERLLRAFEGSNLVVHPAALQGDAGEQQVVLVVVNHQDVATHQGSIQHAFFFNPDDIASKANLWMLAAGT